eukprot:TRINITY_DN95064_c0_g1_i1.p1 TRINITY_DN95064_c0_g1~~TRINITY_DN95064_c0_g1_i1.p1  ORF type:complete len:208 (-),score=20.60 TRINITY_DN95064_c0_g1_i1:279-854(-)
MMVQKPHEELAVAALTTLLGEQQSDPDVSGKLPSFPPHAVLYDLDALPTRYGFIHVGRQEERNNGLARRMTWAGELMGGAEPPETEASKDKCPICGNDHARAFSRPVRQTRAYLKRCMDAALLLPAGSDERRAALQHLLRQGGTYTCKHLTKLGLTEGLESIARAAPVNDSPLPPGPFACSSSRSSSRAAP